MNGQGTAQEPPPPPFPGAPAGAQGEKFSVMLPPGLYQGPSYTPSPHPCGSLGQCHQQLLESNPLPSHPCFSRQAQMVTADHLKIVTFFGQRLPPSLAKYPHLVAVEPPERPGVWLPVGGISCCPCYRTRPFQHKMSREGMGFTSTPHTLFWRLLLP